MPRKELDGAALMADVARLAAADKASPPQACPSLMDAVRQLSGFIETRAALRWPSSAIAALLTEAGYPIDAATLRSYRARLRAEGATAGPGNQVPTGVDQTDTDRAAAPVAPAAPSGGLHRSSIASSGTSPDRQPGRAPPRAPPGSGRSFNVGGNLPPESA